LEFVPQLPVSQRAQREIQILGRLTSLYFALFDARCVEAYEHLAEKAAAHGMVGMEIQALTGLAACLASVSSERSLAITEKALALSTSLGDPLIQTQVRMNWFVWRAWAGDWTSETLTGIHESFESLRQIGDPRLIASSLIDYGKVQWACSEYREAQHYFATGMKQLEEFSGEQNPYVSTTYQEAQFYLPACQLYFGEPGNALRQVDAFITAADRNENSFPAMILRLNRMWIYQCAMDFAGALEAGEFLRSYAGNFHSSPKFLLRCWLMSMGSAKAGLNSHDEALDHLLKAREEMDSQAIVFDWYLRLPLQAALAEVWLKQGNLANAREEANLFVGAALSSPELHWRALAWEMDARVSIAEKDYEQAQRSISKALTLVKEHELPLASWRVYATAGRLYGQGYNLAARKALLRLADSFPADHPLRATLVSAGAASEILLEGDVALLP
jgi:tetratricopeptide (TPR) repeat protein